MGFRIRRPGHIVIRCSDVHRSRDFYSKVVGLNIYGNGNRDMYFLSADFDRNHHMVLIRPAIGGAPKPDGDNQIGLEIGDNLDNPVVAHDHRPTK